MMPRGRSLQQGLDKEAYNVICKFLEERNEQVSNIRPSTIYDYIARSNSSLKRRPKKQLEDSIERVIDVMRADEDDEDEEDDEIAELEKVEAEKKDRSGDWMNKQIVSQWGLNSGASTPTINGQKSDKSKKRNAEKTQKERESKRQKQSDTNIDLSPPTGVCLEDLGGVDNVIKQLEQLILPLLAPEEYVKRNIPIPRGVLLHGPPGCGKTVISRAFAAALGIPFIEILGPSIVSGMSGESEKQVREHFQRAKEAAPCLIFIDEIDVIAPKRDSSQSQMEKRIVAQLLISMDSLAMEKMDEKPVIVLAATNRPDSLDPALRRGGRFDTEINMGIPNEPMREMILKSLTRNIQLSNNVDFTVLAKRTAGFVGSDLKDLVGKAGTWSMDQYREALKQQANETEMDVGEKGSAEVSSVYRLIRRLQNKDLPRPQGFEDTSLSMEAFEAVLPTIIPSSKREGFATVPDTTWRDVGALENVRKELEMAIVEPIKDPERFANYGISASSGVLLWGPPGCGKTLLAKAVAAESKANFISVKGPELLSKYVGESERAIRQVFMRARSSVPCVIFFDELDALVPKRSNELHEASARVVNTLLTELDGLGVRDGIYLIAATNRPEMIDAAMLRPGRLETLLYVELPSPEERVDILKALIQQRRVIDVNLAEFGRRQECDNLSGADLKSLVTRAGQHALWRKAPQVEEIDFVAAAPTVRASVGDVAKYEQLRKRFETRLE